MNFKDYIVIGLCFISMASFASSVDFRHEYKAKTNGHASRVKMGTSFDNNLSVSLELKFKSADSTDFMKDLQSNGSELGIDYGWPLNSQWKIQPGIPIEFSSTATTYKPQLRITYAPESIDGLSLSGRYRLDIKSVESEPAVNNKYRDRYTVNLGYKIQNVNIGLELNYYQAHSDSYILYNNKNSNYENNLTLAYSLSNWTPWLELGDVSVDTASSSRELRSRIGIRYSF